MIGKIKVVLWVGITLLFLPYVGLPRSWKAIISVLLGTALIYISFTLKRVYKWMRFQLRRFEQTEKKELI